MSITPSDLNQFVYSKYYYGHQGVIFTEGVKFFCDELNDDWLLDLVVSVMTSIENEAFVCIQVNVKEGRGEVIITDISNKVIYRKGMNDIECPDGDWMFYKEKDLLLVPSEYWGR